MFPAGERRFYREQGFRTFEEYCQERWGWTRDAGYRYVRASEAARNVETTLQTKPSLSQAVEFASLPPDEQRSVAAEVDFEQTTVQELKEIVKEVKAGTPPAMAVHFSSASEEWYTPPRSRTGRRAYRESAVAKDVAIRLRGGFARPLNSSSAIRSLHTGSMNGGMKDIVNVMSKFLNLGVPLDDVVRRTTWNPAREIHREELGHLSVGATADVAVLRLDRGDFGFLDIEGKRFKGTQRLAACEITTPEPTTTGTRNNRLGKVIS
jgi:hypothetical protein